MLLPAITTYLMTSLRRVLPAPRHDMARAQADGYSATNQTSPASKANQYTPHWCIAPRVGAATVSSSATQRSRRLFVILPAISVSCSPATRANAGVDILWVNLYERLPVFALVSRWSRAVRATRTSARRDCRRAEMAAFEYRLVGGDGLAGVEFLCPVNKVPVAARSARVCRVLSCHDRAADINRAVHRCFCIGLLYAGLSVSSFRLLSSRLPSYQTVSIVFACIVGKSLIFVVIPVHPPLVYLFFLSANKFYCNFMF